MKYDMYRSNDTFVHDFIIHLVNRKSFFLEYFKVTSYIFNITFNAPLSIYFILI